jgi:hypothetical protein
MKMGGSYLAALLGSMRLGRPLFPIGLLFAVRSLGFGLKLRFRKGDQCAAQLPQVRFAPADTANADIPISFHAHDPLSCITLNRCIHATNCILIMSCMYATVNNVNSFHNTDRTSIPPTKCAKRK